VTGFLQYDGLSPAISEGEEERDECFASYFQRTFVIFLPVYRRGETGSKEKNCKAAMPILFADHSP